MGGGDGDAERRRRQGVHDHELLQAAQAEPSHQRQRWFTRGRVGNFWQRVGRHQVVQQATARAHSACIGHVQHSKLLAATGRAGMDSSVGPPVPAARGPRADTTVPAVVGRVTGGERRPSDNLMALTRRVASGKATARRRCELGCRWTLAVQGAQAVVNAYRWLVWRCAPQLLVHRGRRRHHPPHLPLLRNPTHPSLPRLRLRRHHRPLPPQRHPSSRFPHPDGGAPTAPCRAWTACTVERPARRCRV